MRHVLIAMVFVVAALGAARAETLQTAIFAGGGFWCVEADFDAVPGVVDTLSGYTGGDLEDPSYDRVSREDTGHYEAVRITFDAETVTYAQLLHVFWRSIDPTDAAGQFCDRGPSYRTAVFVLDADQAALAETSRQQARDRLGQEIVTPILAAKTFWPAEAHHQNFHETNPLRYSFYREACGRDARVRQLWGADALILEERP
ncbi:MAG TPA: peptide-methionine (S)-S-oxide reductase MsrA [Amaricoccus sp.]|uniref:peptide-methionine (S)-S-oxide reductase MsrA n=1 Tax=Amaricoccus sp. TaxID=1872485 RepID=UPI002CB56339|nr:peptide-methionine (S)-S-oxide reductase MsrA [Amaricoccus sp.]HMQ94187.1 peptide-methionine (S)-S-oxide reductase MsrA [Amaricoccus sp.]HMR52997.1 peptide-methionine (S)-S-oxide reductase MsrA [Amaricoccus sp.]HMR61586.1 peptide-methionine (S)-S-oxide reductase MsrA [Amaricoccus sp.]HMT99858.1 peptide-methionine (S)-S-oxide reductase MsrA [Amaricoccus sp.]